MKLSTCSLSIVTVLLLLPGANSFAHDPIFGVGPHVLFKDGIELPLMGMSPQIE